MKIEQKLHAFISILLQVYKKTGLRRVFARKAWIPMQLPSLVSLQKFEDMHIERAFSLVLQLS